MSKPKLYVAKRGTSSGTSNPSAVSSFASTSWQSNPQTAWPREHFLSSFTLPNHRKWTAVTWQLHQCSSCARISAACSQDAIDGGTEYSFRTCLQFGPTANTRTALDSGFGGKVLGVQRSQVLPTFPPPPRPELQSRRRAAFRRMARVLIWYDDASSSSTGTADILSSPEKHRPLSGGTCHERSHSHITFFFLTRRRTSAV